eukprot:COSAG06_NODE_617_length_13753_cov_134.082241_8_plen_144_part_00
MSQGTARPIPRHALQLSSSIEDDSGLSAFVFGDGALVFLENANGNPGAASGTAANEPKVASAGGMAGGNCSFPIDESGVRYKGLKAAAATITSEEECAAACCAAGSAAAHCNVYQFYATKGTGQASQCWLGRKRSSGTLFGSY